MRRGYSVVTAAGVCPVRRSFHQNKLTGPFPTELARLTSSHLMLLYVRAVSSLQRWGSGRDCSRAALAGFAGHRSISNNSLSGTLPQELGGGLLLHLSLQNNRFSGTIPSSLANNVALTWLCVDERAHRALTLHPHVAADPPLCC